MDVPIQRFLRIGKVQVGLIGLDTALSKVLARQDLLEDEAVAELYAAIARSNYIPEQTQALYQEALRTEYRRLLGREDRHEGGLVIRILGTGCVSCNNIYKVLIEILDHLQLAADVEQIHDLDEIWRHGVTTTPTLIINNRIKSSGRVPTPSEVEQWIREEATNLRPRAETGSPARQSP